MWSRHPKYPVKVVAARMLVPFPCFALGVLLGQWSRPRAFPCFFFCLCAPWFSWCPLILFFRVPFVWLSPARQAYQSRACPFSISGCLRCSLSCWPTTGWTFWSILSPNLRSFDFSHSRSVSHAWPLSVVRVEGCPKRDMLTSHG